MKGHFEVTYGGEHSNYNGTLDIAREISFRGRILSRSIIPVRWLHYTDSRWIRINAGKRYTPVVYAGTSTLSEPGALAAFSIVRRDFSKESRVRDRADMSRQILRFSVNRTAYTIRKF